MSGRGCGESRFGPIGPFDIQPEDFGEPQSLSFDYPTVAIGVMQGTDTGDVFAWTVGSPDLTPSLRPDLTTCPGMMSNGVLVFTRFSPDPGVRWGVWACDTANGGVEFPISVGGASSDSRSYPQISGTTVVWQENHGGQWDIRGATFDRVTHLVTDTFWVAHRATSEKTPRIAGNWVVWRDRRSGRWDIYARNLVTGVVRAVCTNTATQDQPWTDGGWVVWRDWRNAGLTGADIYGRRLVSWTRVRAICRARGRQEQPRVAAGFVVWTDWRKASYSRFGGLHDTDVYAWDAVTGNVFRVAGGPDMEHQAETAHGVVMFLRHRSEFRDTPWGGKVLGANLAR